jgi:hypothetical protein
MGFSQVDARDDLRDHCAGVLDEGSFGCVNFVDHGFVGGMSLREEDSLGVCAFSMGEALAVGGFSLGASLPCLCFLIEAGSAGFGLLAASQASSHSL